MTMESFSTEHGNRYSAYGWEIDHIRLRTFGGSDGISDLRPLHWRNNILRVFQC